MTIADNKVYRVDGAERLAGIGLVVGAVASVVVEAVAASGWKNPGYSYVNDKVAYLGSPYCGPQDGRFVCSPYWRLMLAAWLANGLIVLVAGLILGRVIGGRRGIVVGVVAVAEAAGFALFSIFHDSPDARTDGTITWYFVGAASVIVAANVLPVLIGLAHQRLSLPWWVRPVSISLGATGLVAAAATLGWAPLGLAERLSIYTFLLWQLILGGQLVAHSTDRTKASPTR